MTIIWRKVVDNNDTNYAYCGMANGVNYEEKCRNYNPDKMCTECVYVTGKVTEEEREKV